MRCPNFEARFTFGVNSCASPRLICHISMATCNRRACMKSRYFTAVMAEIRQCTAIFCIVAVTSAQGLWAQPPQQPSAPADQQAAALPADQLDSLVAPIALYPDPMLSNVLMASTYPLEIIQLQQWLAQNKGMNEKQLADAVQKQDWDPSIQSLA